jgi:hypothetical protein
MEDRGYDIGRRHAVEDDGLHLHKDVGDRVQIYTFRRG